MLQSMTGFSSKETKVASLGKITIELKSSNHKFFEIVFHLPEGFLFLEERIKKTIESKIKRGRIVCAVNITERKAPAVFINKPLLKNYLSAFKHIKEEFRIKDDPDIDTLIGLPGVLFLQEARTDKGDIWPAVKALAEKALADLLKARHKEGRALAGFLRSKVDQLKINLGAIKDRFARAIKDRLSRIGSDEERANFLKNTDITEELERLSFHARNFKNVLRKNYPAGKELDFIAQEMQREANTLAAKSFDAAISGRIVQIKSHIEKLREQVQNIE